MFKHACESVKDLNKKGLLAPLALGMRFIRQNVKKSGLLVPLVLGKGS
jgi:hypothetical protein